MFVFQAVEIKFGNLVGINFFFVGIIIKKRETISGIPSLSKSNTIEKCSKSPLRTNKYNKNYKKY